jgi:hypothetical protein
MKTYLQPTIQLKTGNGSVQALVELQKIFHFRPETLGLSLKDGIPARNYGISVGIFFYNFQNIPPRNFYQKLKSASNREFYTLYDALRQFTKWRFLVS